MYDCHPTYQDCKNVCCEWCYEDCRGGACGGPYCVTTHSNVPPTAISEYCNDYKEECTTKCKSSGSTGWISSSNGCSCSSATFYK